MPRKPRKPCRFPRCPNLTDRDFCDNHRAVANYQYNHYFRDPDTNKRYGSHWRKIRRQYVLKHPLCEECLMHGRYVPVEEVHHKVPLSEGGSNDESNLMSLCKSCHSAITLSETNKKRDW